MLHTVLNIIAVTVGWHTWVVLSAIFLFTGMTKGGIGNGLSALTIIFLSLVIDPILAIALTLVVFMICDTCTLVAWWRKWDGDITRFAIVWGFFGVLIGGAILAPIQQGWVSTAVLKMLLAMLGIYLSFTWFYRHYIRRAVHKNIPLSTQRILCVISGAASTTLNAGGISLMAFLLGMGLTSTVTHASSVLIFSVYNIMKLPVYLGTDIITLERLYLGLSFAPIALLGVALGKAIHAYIPTHTFNLLAYVGVSISSVKLAWDIFIQFFK